MVPIRAGACYFVSYVEGLKRYMQDVCTSHYHQLYLSTASLLYFVIGKKHLSLSINYAVILLYCIFAIFATIDSSVPYSRHMCMYRPEHCLSL